MKLENITKRSYDDACGAAHALEIVGERWALLVMRELFWGPKRFSDLRQSLPGISANVLTQRLDGLKAAGVVLHRRLPPPSGAQVYELTDWGYESEPLFIVLGRWAARSPTHDPTLPLSAASLMLSFRTMLSAERAGDFAMTAGFVMGDDRFRLRIGQGRVEIARGDAPDGEFLLTAPAAVIAAAVYGGESLANLEAAGVLAVTGNRAAAERFVTLFPLPEKAKVSLHPESVRHSQSATPSRPS